MCSLLPHDASQNPECCEGDTLKAGEPGKRLNQKKSGEAADDEAHGDSPVQQQIDDTQYGFEIHCVCGEILCVGRLHHAEEGVSLFRSARVVWLYARARKRRRSGRFNRSGLISTTSAMRVHPAFSKARRDGVLECHMRA